MILDQNGRAIYWLKTLYKDRTVKILQDNDEELLQIVKKSISNGDILILYDEACFYDSRLESLYKRRYIKSTNENNEEHISIEIDNEVIPYSSQFRLYIISRYVYNTRSSTLDFVNDELLRLHEDQSVIKMVAIIQNSQNYYLSAVQCTMNIFGYKSGHLSSTK